MFLTLEDAYGLYECVCFESKLAQIAPVVAQASYFLVRGRLQNNYKRGLAIVAEKVRDLEEVAGRRPSLTSAPALGLVLARRRSPTRPRRPAKATSAGGKLRRVPVVRAPPLKTAKPPAVCRGLRVRSAATCRRP